jgi:signal transduction histidine kinase/CheY-like chemotaxis protein
MASERTLRRRVLAIGAVLVLSFIGEASYDSWRLHQQIMAANMRELGNLSRSLATQADRTLQAVDGLLSDTVSWVEKSGAVQAPDSIDAELARRRQGDPQVSALAIVDANGKQTFRSGGLPNGLVDVSDSLYFTAQRDQPQMGLFINAPIGSRSSGALSLVLSRRLNDSGGHFAGIVAATVSLQQLRDAYKAIDLGASSTLLLTLADGTLVIRQPMLTGVEGRIRMPELVAMRAGAPITRMISFLDGRPKLIAAMGVARWPLILAVQRDEGDALKPWVDEMHATAIRTLLLTLVTALTIAGVLNQLKRVEAASLALRKSENRYAMAMDAANEGHAEWNIAGDALFLSAKWRALHGLPVDADVSTPLQLRRHATLHPDDRLAVQAAIEDHLANRTPAIELDYRVRRGDDWCWIHARGRCLRAADGSPANLFCSSVDISDRKREESEKAAFEQRLQQTKRLEALGTLAGGIAHDFNNILGAILGFGEMAQQRAEPGSVLRRHVDRVMQSGERARLLVRRILDFSRSGLADRSLVNVQGVLEEAVAMLAPSLPSGVQVVSTLESGTAAVVGDATQLVQVAMNLLTNAVQAVGEEGRVEMALQREMLAAPKSLLQGDLAPGDYVRLQITDTGPGIAPDVLARIFDPFFTTKKGGEGTGLGLSVVHGIVASLAGAIDIVSCGADGTCVSVWLPVGGERAPQAPVLAAPPPVGAGQVVMVVDDEEPLRQLAEELLAGLGYEAVGYSSAEAALAAFEADPARFDAVLTDQMLPGLQGSELARRLLALRPGLPILLMSGNLSERVEAEGRALGVRAALHKPLALRELADSVAGLFSR